MVLDYSVPSAVDLTEATKHADGETELRVAHNSFRMTMCNKVQEAFSPDSKKIHGSSANHAQF